MEDDDDDDGDKDVDDNDVDADNDEISDNDDDDATVTEKMSEKDGHCSPSVLLHNRGLDRSSVLSSVRWTARWTDSTILPCPTEHRPL